MDNKSLDQKRLDAMLRITQNVIGTSLAGAVPLPAMEVSKMIGIAAADAWMFLDVYRLYFNESPTSEQLSDMLQKAGMIVVTGGVVSYATLRISQGILGGILNFVPVGGWVLSGVLTGSSSLIAGIFWTGLVESYYLSEQKSTA